MNQLNFFLKDDFNCTIFSVIIIIIIRVFCPMAGLSLQTQEPRLQFCPKTTLHAVLSEGRPSTTNSGTNDAVLLGINRCGSLPLLYALHSLISIGTYLKRSEKIPGSPTWKWGEWIWLTGPSALHRHSPQGLNIISIRVFGHIRDPEITITLRPHILFGSVYTLIFINQGVSAPCLYVKYSARRQVRPSTCTTWIEHILVY